MTTSPPLAMCVLVDLLNVLKASDLWAAGALS